MKISRKTPALVLANPVPRRIDLTKSFYSMGRSNKRDIQVLDPTVSRWHCSVFRALNIQPYTIADGNAGIIDLETGQEIKSATGTWVNREKLSYSHILSHGDVIKIGRIEMLYLEKEEHQDFDPYDTLEKID